MYVYLVVKITRFTRLVNFAHDTSTNVVSQKQYSIIMFGKAERFA